MARRMWSKMQQGEACGGCGIQLTCPIRTKGKHRQFCPAIRTSITWFIFKIVKRPHAIADKSKNCNLRYYLGFTRVDSTDRAIYVERVAEPTQRFCLFLIFMSQLEVGSKRFLHVEQFSFFLYASCIDCEWIRTSSRNSTEFLLRTAKRPLSQTKTG